MLIRVTVGERETSGRSFDGCKEDEDEDLDLVLISQIIHRLFCFHVQVRRLEMLSPVPSCVLRQLLAILRAPVALLEGGTCR